MILQNVDVYPLTEYNIPEDLNLQQHCSKKAASFLQFY